MKDICPFRKAQISISDLRKSRLSWNKNAVPVIKKLSEERLNYSEECQVINA